MTNNHAGADWVAEVIKHNSTWKGPMSDFGRSVADLLGEWAFGIYHLDPSALAKVDWRSTAFIEVAHDQTLATFDFNNLTRFVFLCHEYGIRGQISAQSARTVTLMFHPRERKSDSILTSKYHPTLDEAVGSALENRT